MSRVGAKYYGKIDINVLGAKAWEEHDATKTWSDGGAVREILEAVAPELEAAVAKNVSVGISEYLQDAQAALRSDDKTGELFIGLRLHNDEAALIVDIPMKKLIITALKEMRDRIAVDPGAQSSVTQLVDLGRQLVSLGPTHPAPAPAKPTPPSTPREVVSAAVAVAKASPAKPGTRKKRSTRKPATLA